jgi:teichuronic acid biosynthesis glycosyltransferase TuaC
VSTPAVLRVLSISTLFPSPARPAFGNFVAGQMRAVSAREDVELTMISPIGVPPWPLSLREPYRSFARMPASSDISGISAYYPRFRTIPRIGADSNPDRIVEAMLPLARRLHAEHPFDLVDASFFFPDGPAAARIAAELGLPYTIKSRGADIHFWGERPAALGQMVKAAQGATALVAVSQALKADMAALGMPDERIFVHYTGLDRDAFRPTSREAARAQIADLQALRIPIASHLLVTPGALIERKGQALVIEAMKDLPQCRLALAGKGEDEAKLRALAQSSGLSDRVHFLGQVSHKLLPLLFSAADALVLPSASEGLANVWVEALACGAPIVIPDIGGAREVLSSPAAGRIAAREPGAIAAAVEEIIANPASQEDVAAAVVQFSWERNGERIAEIWHQAIAASRP